MDLKDLAAPPDCRAQRDNRDCRETEDPRESQGLRDLPVQVAYLDPRALADLTAHQVEMDLQALVDHREIRDREDHLVCQVSQE